MEILSRAGIALFIIMAGMIITLLVQYWSKKQAVQQFSELGALRPDMPTLVYFTTSTCVPCKTIQRPAIQQLSQQLGDRINVVEIDAVEKPEVATRWGVMSVPTTFVIDPRGAVKHVNHGVVRFEKLRQQFS